MKNSIGLDKKKVKVLTDKLNDLLANYQLYYQNLRGFHWNLKGNDFFTLHIKFEELYNAAQLSIDEIAERIVTLEAIPLHTYTDYVKQSTIKEHKNVTTSNDTVSKTVTNLSTLIEKERDALKSADEAGDESTIDLMTQLIAFQEKTIWMLNSFKHK
ncbi:MAG: DNA starvation/stationary phase protection protein [Candidatus Kapaibacterium sp.]